MKKLFVVLAVVALAMMPLAAMALPVDPGDWVGSRTSGNGISGTGTFVNGVEVSWVIAYGLPGYVDYEYTVTGPFDLSHFTLEVSLDATSADFTNFNWSPVLGPGTFPDTGALFAIKFDDLPDLSTQTFSFSSTRMPMWGDFFIKSGTGTAQNTGFLTDPVAAPFTDWIPVPNTVVVTPIPGTLLLLGGGLLGLVGLRRKLQ